MPSPWVQRMLREFPEERAPAGQVWLCSMCGRTSRRKDGFILCEQDLWQRTCTDFAELVYEQRDERGKWVAVSRTLEDDRDDA